MKRLFASLVVATSAALPLVAGDDLATSAAYGAFRLNTVGCTVVASRADLTELADWPVTYRAGDTITVTAPNGGNAEPLVTSASGDGGVAFAPTAGGAWRLANSRGDTATVGVSWDVFNDGWTLVPAASGAFTADTLADGPDRKLKRREAPPVAYSGDDWVGDLSKAATVTFTPPQGSGLAPIVWSAENGGLESGNGSKSFTFNVTGVWTVSLAFADGTAQTAEIDIISAGFSIVVK